MKMIMAIVSNEDNPKVSQELNKNGFFVTKLATTGGFLMSGNKRGGGWGWLKGEDGTIVRPKAYLSRR